ncbi:CinA family protein [Hyphomicrobium sp.]|uniref:CinA family protein n=1 Tax=Hyphomicrobium sp. TaxID=82 RepID=UPI0025BA0001|nr:CinA family protein [Hyphomicrobium sp.]MCC7253484.1 CinA family protein [Hyphomicrobium sp.]
MAATPRERADASIRSVSMSSTLDRMACAVVKRAEDKALSIVTAESCTAGALATLLADTPGAGVCFHGGFVTYAKACKTALLGIPAPLIAVHTAVSREVAQRMATGALAASGADIAVAITGVLGPEPDEDGNPVGLLHIAVATRGGSVRHVRVQSEERSRTANRERALSEALRLLDRMLA